MLRFARRIVRPTATPWSILFVALLVADSRSARAGAISSGGPTASPEFSYETSGSIGMAGITGKPLIHFAPTHGSAIGPADFVLGTFSVGLDSGDPVTHYDHTPFTINYWTRSVNAISTTGPDGVDPAPMTIRGWITGNAGGSDPSTLTIQFDQGIQPDDPKYYQTHLLPPLPAGSVWGASSGIASAGSLILEDKASSITLDGQGITPNAIMASIEFAPNVPEPSSILVLGALSLCGLIARRRGHRRA